MSKTLLIGLDGATFSILDPLIDRGIMPFIGGFAAEASRATLRSVFPPLTPPAWTSLMTGVRPGAHGVFDFFQKESPEAIHFRLVLSRDIGVPTIWSLASDHGRRVTALNFPMMFPPPQVDGCVVPGGWMPWKQLRLGCHPPGLFDRLKALPHFNARELAMDMAAEATALEGCAAEQYADWIRLHIRRERRWADVAGFLMHQDPADLTAVMFDGVDKLQHLCWRFLDPAMRPDSPSDWEQEVAGLCEDYFRQLDRLLEELVARAGRDTTVVMCSDHGFGPSREVFYVNTWLEREGYLAWAVEDRGDGASDRPQVGVGQITRHVIDLDWRRTVAYAATPSSQGIYLARRGPEVPDGVAPDDVPRLCGEIADRLRRLRHPETGLPVVEEVLPGDEVFAGPHRAMGPDLSIVLRDNGVVSILRSDRIVERRTDPVGTHHPDGVFLARGPGLRPGPAGALSIVDVAPLLLYGTDVPIPVEMTGRLPVELFEPSRLRSRPPRFSATGAASQPGPVADDPVFDAEEEAVLMQRLRALGYVE